MKDTKSLPASLAEFGLGMYEAQAYVELLARGTISASELAYHARVPRTKVYPVMQRLEKKGLVSISHGKPVTFSALPPDESFNGEISAQIEKVNSMNSLVAELKDLRKSAKSVRETKELKYAHISHSSVLGCAQSMIRAADSSIDIMADTSGICLVAECIELLAVTSRKTDIRVLASPASIGSDALRNIARSADIRISEIDHNCCIFDNKHVLVAGGRAGKAAVFESSDILAAEQERHFASAWDAAIPAAALVTMSPDDAQDAYRAIKLIQDMGLQHALVSTMSDKQCNMAALLEENGINLSERKLDDVVKLVDATMRTMCSGSVSYDAKTRRILVESGLNSGHSLPWAKIIEGYLDAKGTKTSVVYQRRAKQGERVHIKME